MLIISRLAVRMSNYRRLLGPGQSWFFTVCLADRKARTLTDEAASLRGAFRVTMAERPFHCDAIVILPDHLHAVWTLPDGDSDFSTRWGAIKARFSMGLRRAGFTPPEAVGPGNGGVNPALRRKGEVGLWQPRFWEHHIRHTADYDAHLRYCWGNPVKHGLVDRAADWPFSSIHRDICAGLVDAEWSGPVPSGRYGE